MTKVIQFLKRYFRSLLGCLYVFTFGLFLKRVRCKLYDLEQYFACKNDMLKAIIPEIKVEEILDNAASHMIADPKYIQGNVNLIELNILNNLVKSQQPRVIFEFGTFDGRTTKNLACNAPEQAVVYTIDLPKKNIDKTGLAIDELDKLFIDKEVSGARITDKKKIVQLYGDTANFDFSPYYDSVDFIFIDASHSYEYILNDSRIARKMLRKGRGIILWHDYNVPNDWPGLMKALHELYENDPFFKKMRHILGTKLVILDYR